MKREILYKRPPAPAKKEVKPVPKAVKSASTANKAPKKAAKKKAAPVPQWIPVTPEEVLMKEIKDWIVAHPHFKWSRMAQEVGLQKSNFYTKFLTASVPSLKPEILPKLVKIMSNYGFIYNP